MYIRKKKWLNTLLAAVLAFAGLSGAANTVQAEQKEVLASAETTVKKGIDVSFWQGTINWTKVKDEVDFAMLRIGYSESMDSKFTEYVAGAKAAGVPMGVYYYSYADSVADAIVEANKCVSWLDQYPATFSYPIVYDAEESKMQSFAADACKAFCDVLRENGYYPMIYANKNWLNNIISPLSKVSDIEFWLANYYTSYAGKTPTQLLEKAGNKPTINSYNSNVTMWQCTDQGVVSGISGGVDTNLCYYDYETLIKGEGYNGYTATAGARKATCTGTTVNIRSGASTAFSVFGTATFGEEFKLKRVYNSGWLEIEYNLQTAYISSTYASVQTDGGIEEEPPQDEDTQVGAQTQYAVCTGTGVNIRQQPNTSCTVLGSANIGDSFKLLRVYDDAWLEIEYNGGVAYIYAQYTTIRTEAALPPSEEGIDPPEEELPEESTPDEELPDENGGNEAVKGDLPSEENAPESGCGATVSVAAGATLFVALGILWLRKKKSV